MNKSMAYKIFYQRLIKINEFAKKIKLNFLWKTTLSQKKT